MTSTYFRPYDAAKRLDEAMGLLRRYVDLSDPDSAPGDHEFGDCLDCEAAGRTIRTEGRHYGWYGIPYDAHEPGCLWKCIFDFLTDCDKAQP